MLGRAYIRIDVSCSPDDKTPIPGNMTVSIGEPDSEGYLQYSAGCFINQKQLEKIYKTIYEDDDE